MSTPIRVKVKADEAPTAEAVRAEQPKTADSDLTMETPRTVFPEQLFPKENPETRQDNRHASAKPLVVRSLKDPPEIWQLVHETPGHFNPGGAFVARLTSSKKKLTLLTLGVMFISGLVAFAVMTIYADRDHVGAAAQVQEEPGTSQTVPPSLASAPASVPEGPQNGPLSAPMSTSPSAESIVDTTPPQATDPQPTDPQAGDPAFAGRALTDSVQPTGVSGNSISKRSALLAGRSAAWSGIKRVTVASGLQSADKPADKPNQARGKNEPAAGPGTSAKPQTPQARQTADLKRSYEKSSSDSASANRRSNTTLSPQLIAPPTTSSAPKAKVIQWP